MQNHAAERKNVCAVEDLTLMETMTLAKSSCRCNPDSLIKMFENINDRHREYGQIDDLCDVSRLTT